MRQTRREFTLGALLAAPLLGAAGQQAPARRIEFTPEQTDDLNRISAWLNSLSTLSAGFVQINPKGNLSQGMFYMARPGRLRFEYRPPSPTLVVATGGNIYVKNSRLNTVDHYSASDTPLGLLLDPGIDLKRNPNILSVERQPGALVLHARSSTNRMQDNIVITFSSPQIQIRQWTEKDAQGGETSVALSQVETGMTLPDTLFAVPVPAPRIRKDAN